MKKIIFRLFIIILFIVSISVAYLSIFGIETTRFNNQIATSVKKLNKDLNIEIKQVKIIIDPIKFQINAKTIGPKFEINKKNIEIESIKTQISISSILNNNFSIKNLDVSTKSLKIKNLIAFARNFKNTPELYFLEKIIKNGYLITNISLQFDENGKIKKNFIINGLVKDAQISILKRYNLDKVNLIFNLNRDIFELADLKFSFNNVPLSSKKIIVKNLKDNFYIEGSLENEDITLDEKNIDNFIKSFFPKLKLKDINLNSNNEFSFNLNKKFKVSNFKLLSKIKINNLKLINDLNLKSFFPNYKNEIIFNNHLINVDLKKNNLLIKGNGKVVLKDQEDKIIYDIKKKDKLLNFDINLILEKNPFVVQILEYKKKSNDKADINLKGTHFFEKETKINSFSLEENKNIMKVNDLLLDKNFKIKKFRELSLDYIDKDVRKNTIKINNKNNTYNLNGSKFNANSLIENLIDDNSNKTKIFDKNFDLNVKIDQVYLDKEYVVNNLIGKLSFKKNEISNAELNGLFPNDKKFKYTVKTNQQEKVSTLFLDQAEPIVKRYKFIKGYKGGSLDFYSSKKDNKSISNLKIYNFKLKELPILTKILTLASLQGIADILSGEGITFDEFEMSFSNQNNLITIDEMYAIGPAISILMDGYIEKNQLISLRGSLVPATTINKAIGTIPILGKILVGSKTGEGVFGVSFKIKGPPKNPETTVNPIKTLTPRFITRTLEKIKKN